MNCRQVQESLGDHSVGLLEGATLTAWEEHVATCAECAKSYHDFQRCMELLNHATLPPPPPDLWSGIHARLALDRTIDSYAHASFPSAAFRQVDHPVATPRAWWPGAVAAMAGFATAAIIMAGLTGAQGGGAAAMASVPPAAVSVIQHNSLESSSPVADGASIVAVDAVTLRPVDGQPRRHQTVLPGREIFGEPGGANPTGANPTGANPVEDGAR